MQQSIVTARAVKEKQKRCSFLFRVSLRAHLHLHFPLSCLNGRNGRRNKLKSSWHEFFETFAAPRSSRSPARIPVGVRQNADAARDVRHWMAFYFIITHRCRCICIQICSTCKTVWETMKPHARQTRRSRANRDKVLSGSCAHSTHTYTFDTHTHTCYAAAKTICRS